MGNDANNGTMQSPFLKITTAIEYLQNNSQVLRTIFVGEGTYYSDTNSSAEPVVPIRYLAGLSIISTSGPSQTFIDCGNVYGTAFDLQKSNITIDGFTIRNCGFAVSAIGINHMIRYEIVVIY